MEKDIIKNRLSKVKSINDFAKLLNDIKRDEFGTSKHRITAKQLLHFSSPKIAVNRYKTFHISKKSGGKREINAPRYQLSIILHMLNIVFKAVYTPCKSTMGFAEGRSVVMNASIHAGHHYVFNIDLKDFFSSIPQARVWKRIQLPPFNMPLEIANVVAGLCCHTNAEGTQSVLPQGASTSPLLTNAICDTLDRRLNGLARKFGVHYTRYADDMTFSSMHNVYQEGSDFRKEIEHIITEQGFTINEKKTRLQCDGERQEVTGLTVNEKVNVARKYTRDLRCILHVWEKEGYGKAYAYFYPMYKRDKGYIKKGEPVMENVIDGKLNYLRMVKGSDNSTYLKLLKRYDKLQMMIYLDNETDKGKSYVYVHSYKLAEFEELFQTSVGLRVSKNNKLVGTCEMYGKEKGIAISKKTQKWLCKSLSDIEPESIVSSDDLRTCFVTLCRDKGKNFWLITKEQMQRSKCLSILNAKIDVDLLLSVWEKYGLEMAVKYFHYLIGGAKLNDFMSVMNLLSEFQNQNETNIDESNAENSKEQIEENIKNIENNIDLNSIEALLEL